MPAGNGMWYFLDTPHPPSLQFFISPYTPEVPPPRGRGTRVPAAAVPLRTCGHRIPPFLPPPPLPHFSGAAPAARAAPCKVTPGRLLPAGRNPPDPGARKTPRSQTSRCLENFHSPHSRFSTADHTRAPPPTPFHPHQPQTFGVVAETFLSHKSPPPTPPTFGACSFPHGSPLDFPWEQDQAQEAVLPRQQQNSHKVTLEMESKGVISPLKSSQRSVFPDVLEGTIKVAVSFPRSFIS